MFYRMGFINRHYTMGILVMIIATDGVKKILATSDRHVLFAWMSPPPCYAQNTENIEVSCNYFSKHMTKQSLLDYRVDQVINDLWEEKVRNGFINKIKSIARMSKGYRYSAMCAIVNTYEEHATTIRRVYKKQ